MTADRVPSAYDSPPPCGRERLGYFAAWVAVAAVVALVLAAFPTLVR